MSIEANKAVVRRLDEVLNEGKLEVIDEIIAPDFVWGDTRGREGFREWVVDARAIFPDCHVTTEHIIAEGDMVALRYSITGTPQSEFFGLPPTGEQVKWTSTEFFRIADGMIAERWIDWSGLSVYRQLGGILTKGESDKSS